MKTGKVLPTKEEEIEMRKISNLLGLAALALLVAVTFNSPVIAGGFVHGVVINVDGEDYYMSGPPDGPGS